MVKKFQRKNHCYLNLEVIIGINQIIHFVYFEKFDIAEIKAAISRLPQKLQNTLILYAVEGYSMKELAELDDCSVEAVKKRVQRARAKIIEALQVV